MLSVLRSAELILGGAGLGPAGASTVSGQGEARRRGSPVIVGEYLGRIQREVEGRSLYTIEREL